MCSNLDQWLVHMDATKTPKAKGTKVDWVVDGHGHLLDPETDKLDDTAQRMLARREGKT